MISPFRQKMSPYIQKHLFYHFLSMKLSMSFNVSLDKRTGESLLLTDDTKRWHIVYCCLFSYRYLDIRWTIIIVDANGKEYELITKDVFYYTTSLSVCWDDIDLPIIGRLNTCSVYAQCPLFRDVNGKVIKNRSDIYMTFLTVAEPRERRKGCVSSLLRKYLTEELLAIRYNCTQILLISSN